MRHYDFDTVIDRRNTNSLKFDFAGEFHYPPDVLPLWVADMDFPAPEPVREALRGMVDRGIFGYSDAKPDYYEAAAGWFRERYRFETEPEWLVKTPGCVFALAIAVRALTEPGDRVLIQPPVYYPFFNVVRTNDRVVVENELVYENGTYSIDFEDFEEKIRSEKVRMFILCSPHNPVCRVWTPEELRRMGEICRAHGVYVVSDEIHCDFAFPEHPHSVFLNVCPELADRTVLCTAPSKTFNLAGLQTANIWIPGAQTRARFQKELSRCGFFRPNMMGLAACRAAYTAGGEWLEQCRAYLRGNLDFFRDFLAQRLPELRLVEPEGTYFAWVDCSGLGLSQEALNELVIQKAKLWLDAGHIFGARSGQFQRFVLACPRATLEEALSRLERAIHG